MDLNVSEKNSKQETYKGNYFRGDGTRESHAVFEAGVEAEGKGAKRR